MSTAAVFDGAEGENPMGSAVPASARLQDAVRTCRSSRPLHSEPEECLRGWLSDLSDSNFKNVKC